jgi:hypothetical protein
VEITIGTSTTQQQTLRTESQTVIYILYVGGRKTAKGLLTLNTDGIHIHEPAKEMPAKIQEDNSLLKTTLLQAGARRLGLLGVSAARSTGLKNLRVGWICYRGTPFRCQVIPYSEVTRYCSTRKSVDIGAGVCPGRMAWTATKREATNNPKTPQGLNLSCEQAQLTRKQRKKK